MATTDVEFGEAPFEIIDGDRGKNYPKQKDFLNSGHCLFLSATNVTKSGFVFADCLFIDEKKDSSLNKGKLRREDIVLTTRGTLGNTAYFKHTVLFENIRINSGMVILRCDREKILPVYLYHFLRSPSFHEQVNSLRSGVAQPQLPIRDMRRIKLPLPTMPEQKRISGILSAYDELIENSQQRIKILESMARALYREWFVHFRFPGHEKVTFVSSPLGKIPEGWEVKKLKNVCRLTMGQSPKSEFYNEMGEGQPFHQGVTNFGNRFPTDRLFCTVEGRIAEAGDSLLSDKVDAAKGNDVVLCHLLATNLGLAISTLTLDVMRFDNNDIETGIRNRIHGGTRERRDREALFDAFAKLAPNAGLSVEPVFLPGLCELVARFINASAAASQVTRCLDHLTRQRVLPDYTKAAGAVDQVFGDRTLKLARDVLHFISRESRLPIDIFKASLS